MRLDVLEFAVIVTGALIIVEVVYEAARIIMRWQERKR